MRTIALGTRRVGALGLRPRAVGLLALRTITLGAIAALRLVAIVATGPRMSGRGTGLHRRTVATRAIAERALATATAAGTATAAARTAAELAGTLLVALVTRGDFAAFGSWL